MLCASVCLFVPVCVCVFIDCGESRRIPGAWHRCGSDLLGLSDTVKAPMTQYCAGRQGDPTCEEYAALDVRVRRRWRLTRRGVGLAPK